MRKTIGSRLEGMPGLNNMCSTYFRSARVADNLFMSPLVLPGIAYGLAALVYFSLLGFRPSLNRLSRAA